MRQSEVETELAAFDEDTRGRRKLDDDLGPVDRLCDRWSRQAFERSSGGGHPIWRLMRLRAGATFGGMAPGMDEDVALLDSILAKCEPRYYAFCHTWYVDPFNRSIADKANVLRTNRTDLYNLWRRTLEYLKGRLHAEGWTPPR